jgi:parallel beta-helix repeat protein
MEILKNKYFVFLCVLPFLISFIYINQIDEIPIEQNGKEIKRDFFSLSKLDNSGILEISSFEIDGDATGVGAHNWSWAVNQPWCSGSGTWQDPYVIQDALIDANNSNGAVIRNSISYFILENNTFFNANDSGLYLSNVDNGRIAGNNFSYNNEYGLYLYSSDNLTIMSNQAHDNSKQGFRVYLSNDNYMSNNSLYNNGQSGLYLYSSSGNTIQNSNLSGNKHGLFLYSSDLNTILGNNASDNSVDGLYLFSADFNNISGNLMQENTQYGIYIDSSNNNTLSGNIFLNNTNNGICIWDGGKFNIFFQNQIAGNSIGVYIAKLSFDNIFYSNNFSQNTQHSMINSGPNYWDNGTIGNYWDNYSGNDFNDDLIGDTPYDIQGTYGSRDLYPIWEDDERILINFPISGNLFGKNAPSYNVDIFVSNMNSTWYSLNGGITNITFSDNGTINQAQWESLANGSTTFRVYVNDSINVIRSAEVIIKKDIISPSIILNSINNGDIYGKISPFYNLSIIEGNFQSIWYSLDEGITNNTIAQLNGVISQSLWNSIGNGSLTLQFFANDTVGNENSVQTVLYKDIISPEISITIPNLNDQFGNTPPKYNITLVEGNLDSLWFTIDGGLTNISIIQLIGEIPQNIWDLAENGSITIFFYANDTLGNENGRSLIVHKDNVAPNIMIISPYAQELYGNVPPAYNITILEGNLDSVWLTMDGGLTNLSITQLNGEIPQNIWDLTENGPFTIIFYANDSMGNTNYSEITLQKDIIAPVITIISPGLNSSFAENPPFFNITIQEENLDSVWYVLNDNSKPIKIFNYSDTIVQEIYDTLEVGEFTIIFYANDTVGNLGYSEITVIKEKIPDQPKNNFIQIIFLVITMSLTIGTVGLIINKKKKNSIELSENKELKVNPINKINSKLPIEAELHKNKKNKIAEPLSPSTEIIQEDPEELQKTEQEVTVYKEKKICVVHKGPISGANYMCPHCETLYCLKCITVLVNFDEKCWLCNNPFEEVGELFGDKSRTVKKSKKINQKQEKKEIIIRNE